MNQLAWPPMDTLPLPNLPLSLQHDSELQVHPPHMPMATAQVPPSNPLPPSVGTDDRQTQTSAQPVSMGPPAKPRKKKAATLSAAAWDPYKASIIELHITEGLPLPEVKDLMEKEFGFVAECVSSFPIDLMSDI